MADSKRVAETRLTLAQIMTPTDANILGNVFGGSILAMIDLTASATAQQFCGHISVTASFDRVDFHEPIEVGNLVTMEGVVTYVGRTSMEISIDVYSSNLALGIKRHTNKARVTMVAVENGKPVLVPGLICESREEKMRFLEGKLRRELRQQLWADLEAQYARFAQLEEAELDRLMAAPKIAQELGL